MCDNTVVVQAINNNFSSSEPVRAKLRELNELLVQFECSLVASHLPGVHNTSADTLSRVPLEDNYRVNPVILNAI